MTPRTLLFSLAVIAIAAPVLPASAHDDDSVDRHERDHSEHRREHRATERAHEAAHDEGFENRGEHRAYHRGLRQLENNFHQDHPGTRHDHYHWWHRS